VALAVETDRREVLPLAPGPLWARFERVGDYPGWWPWLRAFDAEALRRGEVWRCTVSSRLPFRLRFSVTLDEVVAAEAVRARLDGDLTGWARLTLAPCAGGTDLRLTARIAPGRRALRVLTTAAPPVAQRSHDRLISAGLARLHRQVDPHPNG
jgi:hypothetical protein